ncbi:MAG: ATP-binding cassette domain-containing protein [Steroidobacteraceae bacterium]|jgi:sodium transport system ATP-binding protein|nr:ATP-binding cassette domain-containing protein [Steroidobacteraceae bacterium]
MIVVEGLAKRFGEVVAVADVGFEAADGRITGLLGPNGAGKSTTLRMLYGALRPDRGRALVDGHDVALDPMGALARLGVLPHGAGIYPHLTARENVRYFGELHGLRGAALERRIDELLEALEMGAFADRRTKGFSQGQKLKVALARALVHSPRNVVLDEPTNGLDVLATRSLRELIRRLRDAGHCVLFSSHVMQEVAALCDEIVIVGGGRVVARGTPAEIGARVQGGSLEDAFVAALSGDAA